jgi:hypothetical protein
VVTTRAPGGDLPVVEQLTYAQIAERMCIALIQPFLIALHALVTRGHHLPRSYAQMLKASRFSSDDNHYALCWCPRALRWRPRYFETVSFGDFEPQLHGKEARTAE